MKIFLNEYYSGVKSERLSLAGHMVCKGKTEVQRALGVET
jgi:hypothetical protein